MENSCFTAFNVPVDHLELPERFNYPFYYDPDPIAIQAAQELQAYIDQVWADQFGLTNKLSKTIGKMFGVLVVQRENKDLGYLSAFSGNIEGKNVHPGFVPPIYDWLDNGSYFQESTKVLNGINRRLDSLKVNEAYLATKNIYDQKKSEFETLLDDERVLLNESKKKRKATRIKGKEFLRAHDYERLLKIQHQHSLNDKFLLKTYIEHLDNKIKPYKSALDVFTDELHQLSEQRKKHSAKLQKWLFDQYNFINAKGEPINVVDVFKSRIPDVPPSGAGDCAAPKLLQYAFKHKLKPIALAEFWWGKEPQSKVRKHKNYYPACRGKCEPILGHMLSGLDVDPNPLLTNPAIGKKIETVYEDPYLAVINKPAEFLSVPGKYITDSIQERMKLKYPDSTGPLIVHRLDMSTSGLLVIAKTKAVHKAVQLQFKTRKIKKRYVAVLDGILELDEGFINLPLCLDIDNRPFQMVSYDYGKSCRTKYEVIERLDGRTKVYFYPITGRTHQLRVHAAHKDGLNAPIVGDDLYGKKADRLFLHAESISLFHPIKEEMIHVQVDADF